LVFLEALRAGGHLSEDLHAWLRSLTLRLVPAVQAARGYRRFLHDDASPANVMVDRRSSAALIDWGAAGWGGSRARVRLPPDRAVPHALAGYREVTPLDGDGTAEARILYDHVLAACYYATRAVNSEAENWGRPPAGRFVELLTFATEQPEEWARWVACADAVS
jgi:Ser/Thr protein kinase RdoA (MazF antagonist)